MSYPSRFLYLVLNFAYGASIGAATALGVHQDNAWTDGPSTALLLVGAVVVFGAAYLVTVTMRGQRPSLRGVLAGRVLGRGGVHAVDARPVGARLGSGLDRGRADRVDGGPASAAAVAQSHPGLMAARFAVLFGCCLWGALSGWAAAIAATHPDVWSGTAPGAALVLYGAAAWFGSGYLVGSTMRGMPPPRFDLRSAGLTAVLAFTAKGLAPALAAWTAVLIAAAVFGALAGVARTR